MTPQRTSKAIRAIALFEGAKGAVVLLAGFGVLSLIHRDVQNVADEVVRHLHLNPAKHYPRVFLHAASRVTDARLWWLVAGAAAYSSQRFVEAYGLWTQRRWAEAFAAVSGAIYMPFEIYEVFHGKGAFAAVAFAMNALIVAFMLRALFDRGRKT